MSLGKNEQQSNPASVWSEQSPYLTSLYSQAQNLFNSGAPGGAGYDYASQVSQGALPAIQNSLGGGFSGQFANNPYLQNMASGAYQNQGLQGAIQAGLGDISRNFNQNIMPGINSGAAMTNTSGGSRQGIAQGLAAGDANRQSADFVNQMYSNNFQNMMQNQLGALGQMGSAYANADQYTNQMLGMAPQLSNLGYAPEQAYWSNQFNPISQYASLIGSPTVLGGSSSGSGWNVGLPIKGGS